MFCQPNVSGLGSDWRVQGDTLFLACAFRKFNATMLILKNCKVIDVETGNAQENSLTVSSNGFLVGSTSPQTEDCIIEDLRGLYVIPGLCDAHVHVTACTANLSGLLSLPESLVTARAAHVLEKMLQRGFTTVRDAGGADFGLAAAVEEGLIKGPRLLISGHALSQTGGHGDFRSAGEDCCACGAALRGIGRICDGIAEVRKAARDEIRKGAHFIKIMASGGVSSPTDRLRNTQFSLDEIKAIVEEAEAAGIYVGAHAYTQQAIRRAVQCGVRSIEHGNFLDLRTAEYMAASNVFLVPTLATYAALMESGTEAGMRPELVIKVGNLAQAGLESLRIAKEAGVTMVYGSDLLGELHSQQLEEFRLRQHVLSPLEVLQAATINAAKLFQMEDSIGQIKDGFRADLLVLDAHPLQETTVLPNLQDHIVMIIKGGKVAYKRRRDHK